MKRDFDQVYAADADPWCIGNADSPRYQRYVELIMPHVGRGAMLDIGCGFGVLLARFRDRAASLDGVELSAKAVEKGRQRFPFIRFHHGRAEKLDEVVDVDARRFDFIMCSDVICYLRDRDKLGLLAWIAAHLSPGGKACIAGWSPGGKYPTRDELKRLVSHRFVVEHDEFFPESSHALLLCRPRCAFVAITADYETWQPIPPGKCVDWEADVFAPTDRLLDICARIRVPLTLFAEMGEYFWLRGQRPELAARMEEQWRRAIGQEHDVQLHLHPAWLPELGAKYAEGKWRWNEVLARADDYPGDLTELIRRCRQALEDAIRPAYPGYRVCVFRAGAYQAQPFGRLAQALLANGIIADSSVYAGGVSTERGYDYRNAFSTHQPYFASLTDPQLRAPPAEEGLVELPLFAYAPGCRWSFDGEDGAKLAERLLSRLREAQEGVGLSHGRVRDFVIRALSSAYDRARPIRRLANCLLPRAWAYAMTAYPSGALDGDRYFVAIGHTKAALEWEAFERNLLSMRDEASVTFVTLSDMAAKAHHALIETRRTPGQEVAFQVQREAASILGDERNATQSHVLQRRIPLDRDRVLDLGCGAGYWSARIASMYPWMCVTGVDAGAEFLDRARERHGSERVTFVRADFTHLPFAPQSFDCVYADNTLEHAYDVEASLRELHRLLTEGGVLVAAIPPDGRNPTRSCDNHTWKTIASDVALRLRKAGFVDLNIDEVDTYRELGMAPYPPSKDRMLYIRAWKLPWLGSRLERAKRAMRWVYWRVMPSGSTVSLDMREIIAGGHAYCWGYAVALGKLLRGEGYKVRWISMEAHRHERGRGENQTDTHEVIEVGIDGDWHVFDPMSNTYFPHGLGELLAHPDLANRYANRDERCRERGYHLYNTAYWYERVVRVAVREDPKRRLRWQQAGRISEFR